MRRSRLIIGSIISASSSYVRSLSDKLFDRPVLLTCNETDRRLRYTAIADQSRIHTCRTRLVSSQYHGAYGQMLMKANPNGIN